MANKKETKPRPRDTATAQLDPLGNTDDTLNRPGGVSSSGSATQAGSDQPDSLWRTWRPPSSGGGGTPEQPQQPAPADGHEILGLLGRGAMGVVYKARQVGLNRIVALKMILSGHHASMEDRVRFRIEAEAAARLQHPNIVQVFDVGERDGHAFFSLEFLEGGTLQERMKKGAVTNREAAETVKVMAEAVHFAHQRGIIHRDLKPANILFSNDGVPKLTDFGLAKSIGDQDQAQTGTGTVLGTPSYMAPEQARGKTGEIGAGADIYALGVILYELLTGRTPFRGETVIETLQMLQTVEPVAPMQIQPKVSRDLQTICLKCLEKTVEKRYATAEALAQDLNRYLEGEPILARPVSTGERAYKWCKRHPMAVALIGVSMIAIFGLVGVILWSNANLQVRLEEYRRAALHAEAEKLLGEAEEAFTRDNYPLALQRVLSVNEKIDAEPSVYEDLRERTTDMLGKTKPRVDNLQAFQEARKKFDEFKKQHDEVFFYQTLFTGTQSADNLKKVQDLATEALAQFQIGPDGDPRPRINDNYFSKEEKAEINGACYELLLALAESAARLQSPKQALQILDRAAKTGMDTKAYHLRRARYLAMIGDSAESDRERRLAQEHKASMALDYFLVGEEYYQRDQPLLAVAELEKALQIQPDLFWAQYYLAICELRLHRLSQAKTALAACLGRRSDFLWIYLLRGFASAEQDDFASAEADFRKVEQALTTKPDELLQFGLYVYRSVLRVRQGDKDPSHYEQAVSDLKKAIDLRPKQYQAYVNLAQAYEKQKQLGDAVGAMDKAIELEPSRVSLYRRRARLQVARGDDSSALRDLDKSISLEPEGSLSLALAEDCIERGRIQHRKRDYKEALHSYERALAIRPEMVVAHRWRGESLAKMGQHEEAVRAYNQYVMLGGTPDVEVFRDRAQSKVALNRWAEAIEDYTKALTIRPDDLVSSIGRGWAYAQSGALQSASNDFDKAVKLDPKNGYAMLGRAYASVQLGSAPKGLADAESAVRLGPQTPALLVNAACVYALALNKLETKSTQDQELRTRCQEQAVKLLYQALDQSPARERAIFWNRYIKANPDLKTIRQLPALAQMEREFSASR